MAKNVYVIAPNGEPMVVPRENVQKALAAGFTLDTPELAKQREEAQRYGEGAGAVIGGTLGALRGASVGLSDRLITALPGASSEVIGAELEKYRKYNPTLSTGAEISAGLAGALFVPASLPGLISKLGVAAGETARAALAAKTGAQIGQALGVGAKLSAAATTGITEGALYGAGGAITEHELGGHDYTVESVLPHIGIGALLGGGLSAGVEAAKGLVSLARQGLQGAYKYAKGKASAAAIGLVESAAESVGGGRAGAGVSTAAQSAADAAAGGGQQIGTTIEISPGGITTPEGQARLKQLANLPSERDILQRKLQKSMQQNIDETESVIDTAFRHSRPAEIAAHVKDMPEEYARQVAEELHDRLASKLDALVERPDIYAPSPINKFGLKLLGKRVRREKLDPQSVTNLIADIKAGGRDPKRELDALTRKLSAAAEDENELTAKGVLNKLQMWSETGTPKQTIDRLDRYMARKIATEPKVLGGLQADLDAAKTPHEIYDVLNKFKTNIDKDLKFEAENISPGEQYAISALRDLRHELATALEDETLWGQAGARQKAFNEAFSEYSTTKKNLLRRFGQKIYVKSGQDRVVSPVSVNRYFNQIDAARSEVDDQILEEFSSAQQKLLKEIAESSEALPEAYRPETKAAEAGITKTKELRERARELLSENSKLRAAGAFPIVAEMGTLIPGASPAIKITQKLAQHMDVSAALKAATETTTEANAIAHSKASAGAQTILGVQAAASALSRAQDALVGGSLKLSEKAINKALTPIGRYGVQPLVVEERNRRAAQDRANQALARSVGATSRRITQAIEKVVKQPTAKPPARKSPGKTSRAEFEKKLGEVSQIATNPAAAMGKIQASLESLSETHPELALGLATKAVQAASYLASIAPKNPMTSRIQPMLDTWQPSHAQMQAWLDASHAIEDPASVAESLAHGIINVHQVDAIKTIYPETYNRMVAEVGARVAAHDKRLPYRTVVNLSVLFGTPLDQSLEPQNIARLQSSYQSQPTHPADSASGSKAVTIARAQLTKFQEPSAELGA